MKQLRVQYYYPSPLTPLDEMLVHRTVTNPLPPGRQNLGFLHGSPVHIQTLLARDDVEQRFLSEDTSQRDGRHHTKSSKALITTPPCLRVSTKKKSRNEFFSSPDKVIKRCLRLLRED